MGVRQGSTATTTTVTRSEPTPDRQRPRRTPPQWSRRHPFPATLRGGLRLTGPGSTKDVRHYTLDLTGSGLSFEPGDSVGIIPTNDPALVELLLDRTGLDGAMTVDAAGPHTRPDARTPDIRPLFDVLTRTREISLPSLRLLKRVAMERGGEPVAALLATGDRRELDRWLWGRDVIDVLESAPDLRLDVDDLISLLHPLVHRAYSIASSPLSDAGVTDLTVAAVAYRRGSRDRSGVCSSYLAERIGPDGQCGAFLLPNKRFRLPEDDVPVIMIGPGTGVAPFRAFLQQRRLRGATGANWLFFGDRNRTSDFLYGSELAAAVSSGLLTRLDLAFSRDQDHKVYVQHRMREHGRDLYAWLEDGAHLYVCGDAEHMAVDVDEALVDIVAEHGGLEPAAAIERVAELRSQGRYHRDVY